MQRDRAALPLVRDLHLQTENIAELALERDEVGIDRLGGVARAGAADVVHLGRGAASRAARDPRPGEPRGPWRRFPGSALRDPAPSRRRAHDPC